MWLPRSRTPWIAACAVACAAGLGIGLAEAAKPKLDPRVHDLKKKNYGRTSKQWCAEWWQWATSFPADASALADDDGDYVEVGQRGPVWFLCGTFGSGAVTRTAKIPENRALFFPILNSYWDNVGFPEPFTVDELKERAAENVSQYDIPSLRVTVDGSEIQGVDRMRVASDAFAITLPPGSLFESLTQGQYQAGVHSPAVTDGYWVMLRPLALGPHTIRIQGSAPGVTLDVTYDLDVIRWDQPFPPEEE